MMERGLSRFGGRASLRAWLHRIAAELSRRRSPGAVAGEAPGWIAVPARQGAPVWVEPYPGDPPGPGAPHPRYDPAESISLAFVTALQHLPPAQRAALILRDIAGFTPAETADILNCPPATAATLTSRARASLPHTPPHPAPPPPGSPREHALTTRFARAYTHRDTTTLTALLTPDATLTMPPLPLTCRGPAAITSFLTALHPTTPYRLLPARANRQPAFGCYLHDTTTGRHHAQGLLVLTLHGDHIAALTRYLDTTLTTRFGLPQTLPDE